MRKLSLILVLTSVALLAAPPAGMTVPQPSSGYRLLSEVTDEPAAFWYLWWTGTGNVSDFLVCNAMQGGVFSRHILDEHLYEGLPAYYSINQYPDVRGNNGEYPAGSKQFYLYAMGFWFGALDQGTPNVSKAAFSSDMGGMSVPEMEVVDRDTVGLYFSNMLIPEGYGLDGEGDRLFARPGETPKPYQVLWPFADTALNKNRPPESQLDPSKGDLVSHEDTYAVGGDWIPLDDATTIWLPSDPEIDAYDNQGLGIRVEQRSYAWRRSALTNVIVLNYKIRNMNEHVLEAPYFGYFADPDIGADMDDLADYDALRDLGYAYDVDGSESGWGTPAGYVGVVLIETTGDVGATGFEAWPNDSVADIFTNWKQDSLKYEHLKATDFESWDDPEDVRIFLKSGPYPDMNPGDEYDYTLAVVFAETLSELQANADAVKAAFNQGFPWIGIEEDETTAPGAPVKLNLTTANISDGLIGLRYSLPHASDINISVFDAAGRRVQTLKQGHTPAGSGEIAWNASRVSAGVYFVRLSACGSSCTERVLIVR